VKYGGTAQPKLIVDGGITADDCAGRDVTGNSGLGSGDGPIADFAVSRDANLAGKDDVVSNIS
jgi:hypothetical protein